MLSSHYFGTRVAVLFLAISFGLFSAFAIDITSSQAQSYPLTSEANSALIAQAVTRAEAAESRGDVPALVQALNDEADGRLRAHDYDAGEKLRIRVLHLQEQHAGRNSLVVSDALLNLGWFYANMARYEEAQQALDRCRDIRERLLGPDAAPVAEVLNAIGALEENRGNLTLAEAFYQQAILIQEKALGTERPGHGQHVE